MMNCRNLFSILISIYLQRLSEGACSANSLAIYELHFEAYWDRRDFPKHYPEWRPPASWSKLIGYTHGPTFELFHKGSLASPAVKLFAETGQSQLFDLHTQGTNDIFDAFSTTPIISGVGETRTTFFASGNQSKVSMVSKIVPSPDWFIGVDSRDLCPNGVWLEYIHLEASPSDAGTDSGLAFTSPNWPTDPPEKICQITSQFPDNEASSFFYADLDVLPAIAQFTITKLKEYTHNERFDASDYRGIVDEENSMVALEVFLFKKSPKTNEVPSNDINEINPHKDKINYVDEKRNGNSIPEYGSSKNSIHSPLKHNHINHIHHDHFKKYIQKGFIKKQRKEMETATSASNIEEADEQEINKEKIRAPVKVFHGRNRPRRKRVKGRKRSNSRIPTGDAMAVIDDIVKNYQRDHRRQLKKRRREERRRRREQLKKIKPPRDCRMSDWSSWSTCNKSCGIGEKFRTRRIIRNARRGGMPCLALNETTWCGSAKPCKRNYFSWN